MPEFVCSADDPRWHEERRRGVTATDITAILGLSPYESAYSLYCRKTGDTEDGHQDNDRLRLGRELEPIIIRRWGEAHPLAAYTLNGPQLWRSSSRPWQMATTDATSLVETPGIDGLTDEPVELKSWADIDRDAWAGGIPPRVRAQVLWQMDTLDVPRGHVGVLFLPSGEFRSHTVEHSAVGGCKRSAEYVAIEPGSCDACTDIDLMRDAARDFLDRIDLRDPPPVDGSSATLAALRERFPAHKGKEAEINAALWEAWQHCKDMTDAYDKTGKELEAQVRVQLGEASILTVNGTKVATRVTGSSQVKAHTRSMDYIRRTPKKGEEK